MPTDAREDVTSTQRLHELLLGYLGCPRVRLWPGADGLTLDEILRSYPEAAAAGQVPGLAELRARHPELAGELDAFFAGPGRSGPAPAT